MFGKLRIKRGINLLKGYIFFFSQKKNRNRPTASLAATYCGWKHKFVGTTRYVVFHASLCSLHLSCLTVSSQSTGTCCRTSQHRETLSAKKNLEKNLRNLEQEACCARQITYTALIAKANQENSPHKPACNDKRITGLKNVPTGKTGRSCHPSKREGHAGMPPSDSREKRNKGEQGMHGGIISQCIHRSPG